MKRQILAITLVLFTVGLATASTQRDVPGTYANIQAAINASVNGDTVMVAAGTYTGSGNRNLDFNGKKITVRSVNGPADCNIDCQGLGRGFYFHSYEDASSVVKGFTIRNGTANNADGYGGAIECLSSSPVIVDCIILNNTASDGGGIECDGSSAQIINCLFQNNAADSFGGAIDCQESTPTIRNCTFFGNSASDNGGGAIFSSWDARPKVSNCIFVNNGQVAIYEYETAYNNDVTTFDCLFYNNPDGDFYDNQTFRIYTGASQLNAIPDGFVYDNISGDPLFKKGPLGNFYLSNKIAGQLTNSPCIDAGSASASSLGMNAYTTRTDNVFDSNTVDIGYHNYITSTTNYTLTTSVVGIHGSISPLTGNTYAAFTEVKLTATADTGYKVKQWTGTDDNNSVDSNNVVTMTGNKPVTVEFQARSPHNLTTSVVGGHGSINPASGTQYDGTVVALTAIPDAGYQVKAWTGTDNDSSTNANNTVTMNGDKTVTVTFVPSIVQLTVLITGEGGHGSVLPKSGYYPVNSTIPITAYPRVGYKVVKWTGTTNDANDPNDPNNATKTVLMDDNKTVTLQFGLRTKYQLNTNVVGGHGGVSPASGLYYEGDTITLTANPNANYMVQQWTGTDTVPGWGSKINTVKMTGPKTVSVQFQTFRTFNVPGNYPYLSIQDALNQANDGDVIVIAPSVTPYVGTGFFVYKNVTIRSTNPSDPNVVAATVIDCTGEHNGGFELHGSGGIGYATLDGITLQNGNVNILGYFQPDPSAGDDGFGGGSAGGLGVFVEGNHVISNCIIRGFRITADPAHDGIAGGVAKGADGKAGKRPGDVHADGGRGGEGTSLFGAGIYVYSGSPTIKNTLVEDCHLIAGNGGNGGNGENGNIPFDANFPGGNGGSGGMPGRAYGAGIYCDSGTNPTFEKCIVRNCTATGGRGGIGGNGGTGGVNTQLGGYGGGTTFDIGQTDPSLHSANGAGVCVDAGVSAVFKDCDFSNSIATGSITGLGGINYPAGVQMQPHKNFQIPSFGGGVYCGGGSATQFMNCRMQSNSNIADPNPGNVSDQYIGYGAGLCILNSSYTELTGCDLSNNNSPVGGGIFCNASADLHIGDTSFQSNQAQLGGGLYVTNSVGDINDCLIQGNTSADTTANQEQFGLGGGLMCAAANVNILNSVINQNRSGGSGGGVYFAGQPSPLLKNCLITRNESGRDGAGVSCEGQTEPNISNCTIANNTASGIGFQSTFGGGLSVADDSGVNVKDSIIWGNQAINGQQIAVTSLNPNMPSYLTVSYSNVLGGEAGVFKDIASTLAWDANTNLTGGADYYPLGSNPNFVTGLFGSYYLSQPTVIEPLAVNSPINDPNVPTSPCVNAGSDMAEQLGLSGRSTRIDNRGDTQKVDMGYHFPGINTRIVFTLTTSVSGNGRIDPCSGQYYDGTGIGLYISLTATPDAGWRVKAWHGTDNDSSKANNNTVFLNSNKTVTVEFELITLYQLTATVFGGHGSISIDPTAVDNKYPGGTTVNLTAIPDAGYRVKQWVGTDNDSLKTKDNKVTIVSNTVVTVEFELIPLYQLTTSVIGGHGSIDPAGDTYHLEGTTVPLTATPDTDYRVKQWTGADNASTATTNTVTMIANKIVTVEFEHTKTLLVSVGGGEPGFYSTIQDALVDAVDGDTIVVLPGVYSGGYNVWVVQVYKSVEIKSVNPDDPTCVASTIIDGYLGTNPTTNVGVVFLSNTDSNTILNGFTIRNCGGNIGNSADGTRTPVNHPDGYDGGSWGGSGIRIESGASPTIKNCIIRDNWLRGGFGGNGVNADTTHNAGRGGWGGYVWGGGVYCGQNSSPTFINCRIINNQALGGNGGNGGNGGSGNLANYGGSWSRDGDSPYYVYDIDGFSMAETPVVGPLWKVWNSYLGGFYHNYVGDYRWYSGYGGGAFCDVNSNVTFIDCNIIGNLAQGGISGHGGLNGGRQEEPMVPYRIPSFGGGAYCAAGSTITFTGCNITDNNASEPNAADYSIDPYLGHGGGVCAEDTAKVDFNNCNFTTNQASVGGGMHFANANAVITDSMFLQNTANHGGGLFGEHGLAQIINCDFTGNIATSREPSGPNDPIPSLLGQGGGMHLWAADVNIFDCSISQNQAQYSGGGMYVGGEGTFWLDNCLLTNNNSRRDGGAISNNIFGQLIVSNCTIADNRVTGSGEGVGFGGGISSFYNSYSDINDSIIWGNKGIRGSQLSVGTNYFYDPAPSSIKITYSDIMPFPDPNQILKPDGLDVAFCIDTTGSMYGDIAAVKTQMNQIITEIAKVSPNYRIAVVDYKDFNDPNGYGGPGDYPYHNALNFSNNPAAITAGINSLSTSGGADGPESVYAAVMHCVDGTGLDNRLTATGNSRFIDPNSPSLIWRSGNISRIVILMGDAQPHDPEPFTRYTLNDVVAAAIAEPEPKLIFTIPVRNDPTAVDFFTKLGEGTGGAMLQAADSSQVVNAILKAIQLAFAIPNPVYIEGGCSLFGWRADSNTWDPNTHNIGKDPNFTAGYYLSQIDAGQDINSPCVDKGSNLASVLGMDTYTTRTDGIFDDSNVDMGYHYRHATTAYTLTAVVIDGNGTVEPNSKTIFYGYENNVITLTAIPEYGYKVKQWTNTDNDYSTNLTNTVTLTEDKYVTVEFVRIPLYQLTTSVIGGHGSIDLDPTAVDNKYLGGTTVDLTAIPDTGYRVKQWNGTDNDSLKTKDNKVTIDSNATVTVEFEHTQVLQVPGKYSSIQQALDAAGDGDTIVVSTGIWGTSQGYTIRGKDITLTSTNPDDPCVVASTIIQMIMPPGNTGWVGPAFTFFNVGPDTLLNGITIRGFRMRGSDGLAPTAPERDGENGSGVAGGAISCRYNASPTIKNCLFDDCNVTGGNGSNGINGSGTGITDPNRHGGHGGWPGFALGGAIACLNNSNPAVINCTFTNCGARGGNGGDGGNGSGSPNWGKGGRGGGWYYGLGHFWYGSSWIYGYHINDIFRINIRDINEVFFGEYDFYTRYSGHGGAVYVGTGCSPTFTHCNFVNNNSFSGVSGICGQDYGNMGRDEPSSRWIIDNSGGAVYCDTNSTPRFTDCVFSNNTADTNNPAGNDDPHISFGGAIAFEDGAFPIIEKCSFNGNDATAGGGIYCSNATTQISDSNFTDNTAYNGGASYYVDSNIGMANCNITGNQAFLDSNDPNVAASIGQGGGIYCGSSDAMIFDCNILNNLADASGGGVYFGGQGDYLLHNCLLAENITGRDGGGVSANWYSNLKMANCTIANNMATGTGFGASYGGGLFCSYQNYTSVIDSILWNNSAGIGAQIAIGTGFEYDKRPSVVDVNYSDVQGGAASVYVDIGNPSVFTDDCKLNWGTKNLTGTSLTNPKLVKGFYLSQPITGDSNQVTLGLSICVDKGSTDANLAGMYRHTTRTDRVPEEPNSIVDMGYHYVLSTNLVGDFNFDKYVNFLDYLLFADHWMDTDCGFPDWCYGTDLNQDGRVNWDDFNIFASNYGAVPIQEPYEPNDPNANDHTPPSPDPMTWASVPASTGATSITMTATTATDNSTGTNVEYYFQRTDGNGSPDANSYRNWDSSPTFTDSNHVVSGSQYGYRVRARDTVPYIPADGTGQRGNKTAWSVIGYAVAGSVPVPTAPSGLTATVISTTQINLSWTDNSSNEAGFKIERKIGSGSFSQIDTVVADVKTYNNTGLTAATAYSYRVRAYNGSGDSTYSNIVNANTTTTDGNQLPTPTIWYNPPPAVPVDGNNSGQTKIDPNGSSSSYWWHKIAIPVPVGTPLVYYRFYCTSQSAFSSQWVPSNGTGNVVYPPIVSGNPNPVIKYGTNAITYCVPVATGTSGLSLNWRVDVSFNPDGSGTQNHSSTVMIYAP